MKTVSSSYLDGIREGREVFSREGLTYAADHLANIRSTMRGFAASSPVGQMLRGERDFWIDQIKRAQS